MPDKKLAQRLGRSWEQVGAKRRLLGIASGGRHTVRWTPKEMRLLGTMPDEELAKRLERSILSVRHRRQRLGISLRSPDMKAMVLPASQKAKVLSYFEKRRHR